MPIRAIYPGTFDPITLGHLDVIKESLKVFDKLVVVILENPAKTPMFSTEQREKMIKAATSELTSSNRVSVGHSSAMTVDVAAQVGAKTIVRGVRLNTDFEQELFLCFNNKELNNAISTIFIPPHQEHLHISSTAVREILKFNRCHVLTEYLPGPAYQLIMEWRRHEHQNV